MVESLVPTLPGARAIAIVVVKSKEFSPHSLGGGEDLLSSQVVPSSMIEEVPFPLTGGLDRGSLGDTRDVGADQHSPFAGDLVKAITTSLGLEGGTG